jgi:hypothetical protein
LALALAVAACGWTGGTAITVNGRSLSNDTFMRWVRAQAKLPNGKTQITGVNDSTFNTNVTTGLLNNAVYFALMDQELERRHITLTDSDLKAAETSVDQQAASQTDPATGQQQAGNPADGKKVVDALGSYKTALVRFTAGQTALEKAFAHDLASDAQLRKIYAKNAAQYQGLACVTAILSPAGSSTSTSEPSDADYAAAKAQLDDILGKITNPADFEAIAAQVADQQGQASKGNLGCQKQGTYAQRGAPELDAAIWSVPVGQVSQPIKISGGYVAIQVTARGNLTYEQAKPLLQTDAADAAVNAYQKWLAAAAKRAHVSVDPQWGSWSSKTASVVPPVGATSSTTTPAKRGSTTTSAPTGTTAPAP